MSHSHSTSSKRLLFVVSLTVLYMVAEIVGGLWSGSLALLADAGHMATDAAAGILSLVAVYIAHKPPTEKNTYGFYRAEILAALVNGTLLGVASLWILLEAWERFSVPVLPRGEAMMVIAIGGLLVNLAGIYLLHGHGEDDLNLRGLWWHMVADTLGSVSAALAGFAVWKWQVAWVDPLVSVLLAVLILWGAWRLLKDCVHVLLEGVPKQIDLAELEGSLGRVRGVKAVYDLHVWSVGNGVTALSAHVSVSAMDSYEKVLATLIETAKKGFGIKHVTFQIEPVGFSAPCGDADTHCSIDSHHH